MMTPAMTDKKPERIIRFNNGIGALLCNGCNIILRDGFQHAPGPHYCAECRAKKPEELK